MKMQLLLSLQLQKHDRLPVEWDKYLKVGSESIKKKNKTAMQKVSAFHFSSCMVYNSYFQIARITPCGRKGSGIGVPEDIYQSRKPGLIDVISQFLQSVMHKSCLRVKLQFFHTPDYPHTALLYLPLSAFQRNNIKSGASHVRTIFTVYVGLLCVTGVRSGIWECIVLCFLLQTGLCAP